MCESIIGKQYDEQGGKLKTDTLKKQLPIIIVLIMIVGLSIFMGFQKADFHSDEGQTYGLSNYHGGIEPRIKYGKIYKETEAFDDYVKVTKHPFDYANVFKQQEMDVHPPLYYLSVHTVCSFFKGMFSKWFGIGINLFWVIITLIFLYLFAKKITSKPIFSSAIVLLYGTSLLLLDSVVFNRMYAQFSAFVIVISYLVKCYWDKEQSDKKFYIGFAILAFGGMFTHYYFSIYLFALTVFFSIHILRQKRKKEFFIFAGTLGVTGLIYLAIWPHIIKHILGGYRGKEAFKNALTTSGILKRVFEFLKIANFESFNGLMIVVIAIIAIVVIIQLRKKSFKYHYELGLAVCSIFYFLVITKIAPFIVSRYIMPIGWIWTLFGVLMINELVSMVLKKKSEIVIVVLLLVLNVVTLAMNNWSVPCNYSERGKVIDAFKGCDAILYTEANWESLCYFQEVGKYDNYLFVNNANYKTELSKKNGKFILVAHRIKKISDQELTQRLKCQEVYKTEDSTYYLVEK